MWLDERQVCVWDDGENVMMLWHTVLLSDWLRVKMLRKEEMCGLMWGKSVQLASHWTRIGNYYECVALLHLSLVRLIVISTTFENKSWIIVWIPTSWEIFPFCFQVLCWPSCDGPGGTDWCNADNQSYSSPGISLSLVTGDTASMAARLLEAAAGADMKLEIEWRGDVEVVVVQDQGWTWTQIKQNNSDGCNNCVYWGHTSSSRWREAADYLFDDDYDQYYDMTQTLVTMSWWCYDHRYVTTHVTRVTTYCHHASDDRNQEMQHQYNHQYNN